MPRQKLIRTNEFPYHITSRSRNRDWYLLEIDQVWDICMKSLKKANKIYNVKIHTFVLMNNHYHLLVTTPEANIDRFMYELNKNISLLIRNKTERENQIFGGRYKWTIINNSSYLKNVLRYIYQNPMVKGLIDRCENYPYSSLYYLMNKQEKFFTSILNEGKDKKFISWINVRNLKEEFTLRDALKYRGNLKIKKNSNNKKIMH